MWRMLGVGRILICVYTTNEDCLLVLLLLHYYHACELLVPRPGCRRIVLEVDVERIHGLFEG